MQKAPLPAREEERLAALRALKILDTPPEERFDRITRIAQRLFDVPIVLLSLVDADRQWFKSRQGLDVTETPREISFCGHAILGSDILVIPDAQQDPRFADNPMVCGEPYARFYAGYPLSGSDGSKLGTLCIKDRRPRKMSEADLKLLRDLGALVENELNALELNRRLAEQLREELEAEVRLAREMEIARQVQNNLLPKKLVPLRTLEYAGGCLEARAVGGDYYDFLDLGEGRVGLVLADICGKGISAALLMASLQAHLRSQRAQAREDLPALLCALNQTFHESTETYEFATLFFGVYDDRTRCLRYTNCGHPPPLLLRPDGTVERLSATATVLGPFERWDCASAEVEVRAGDTLVVYSDGVSEARREEEEFGETRLLDAARATADRPPTAAVAAIIEAVEDFSGGEQEDDLTLVVARGR